MNNFRYQAKLKTSQKWQGIQQAYDDGTMILGGNIIHHLILWNATQEEADNKIASIKNDFPNYDIRAIKC